MLLKKVKNAIVLFAATVVVSSAVVCNVSAATHIDKNADINITAQIGEDDSSVFSKTYNGTVNIDLIFHSMKSLPYFKLFFIHIFI